MEQHDAGADRFSDLNWAESPLYNTPDPVGADAAEGALPSRAERTSSVFEEASAPMRVNRSRGEVGTGESIFSAEDLTDRSLEGDAPVAHDLASDLSKLAELIGASDDQVPQPNEDGAYKTSELRQFIKAACRDLGVSMPANEGRAWINRIGASKLSPASDYNQSGINRHRQALFGTLKDLTTRSPASIKHEAWFHTANQSGCRKLRKNIRGKLVPFKPTLQVGTARLARPNDGFTAHPSQQDTLFLEAAKAVGYSETSSIRDLGALQELYRDSPEDALQIVSSQLEAHTIQVGGFADMLGHGSPIDWEIGVKVMSARMELAGTASSLIDNEFQRLLEEEGGRGATEAGFSEADLAELRQQAQRVASKEVEVGDYKFVVRLVGGDVGAPSIRISRERADGKGSFKEYYCSVDDNTLTQVAVLRPKNASEKARREVREEAALHHELQNAKVPGVLQLYDSGDGTMVTEDMDSDAGDFFESSVEAGGIVNMRGSRRFEREVMRMGIAVSETLGAMHELGKVHLDIKPDNVLIKKRKGKRRQFGEAKVADFGLAHDVKDRRLTSGRLRCGTPQFMAPEVAIKGRGPAITGKADVFSLGTMLFQLRYGVEFVGVPSSDLSPRDKMPHVQEVHVLRNTNYDIDPSSLEADYNKRIGRPEDTPLDHFDTILLSTLSPDPDKRPTAERLASTLQFLMES